MGTSQRFSRPAILTENGLHADWVVKPLIEAGFAVDTCPFEEIADRLRTGRYNAVVLGRFYVWRQTKQGEIEQVRRTGEAVAEFVRQGGGAYLALPCGEQVPYHLVLEQMGAEMLKLQVTQEVNSFEQHGLRFIYADDIDPAFVDGVAGVWLPIRMGLAPSTFPVNVTEDWTVILRAARESHTERLPMVGYGLPGEDLEGYKESVPLMAARNLGEGRVVVCGITGGFNIYSPHNYPLGQKMLTEGIDGKSSGFLQLFVNLLRWLTEPSFNAGTLGGAETNPLAVAPQVPRFPDDPPVIWAPRAFPPDATPKQGLIGARTAYSNGSGTVAEYVAKAKAAGHDFIVFLEDFPSLTEEKFNALKAECEAYSSESFFAVPGYTLRDAVGSHHFQYGYAIELPREDLLSEDGTHLQNKAGDNPRNNRVEHPHFSLIFGEMHLRGRRGTFRHAESPKTILQNRANDSIAVVTWEDGKIIEDVREDYRFLMDKGLRLSPTVLTFINSPEDFDRALASGWHNQVLEPYGDMPDKVLRKHMAPELEWWGTIDEEIVGSPRYRFDSWQYGNPFQSVSSGPVVRAWTMSVSGRDQVWQEPDHEIPPTADWFRVDVAQYRLRMHVTSEVGLAEVIVYDGVNLFRRWQLNGETSFEMELDLAHHQQTHLLLEARDIRGGVAMTADYACMRLDWCEFYCADRNNPLNIGYEKDENGFAYGWAGTDFLTYNNHLWGGSSPVIGKWWHIGDMIYPVPMDPVRDETAPTDGGVGAGGAGLGIKVKMPELDPPELGLMMDTGPQMISTDVAICDFLCDYGYKPDDPYFTGSEEGFGLYGMYPTRYLRVNRRAWTYRPKPGALTTVVHQYDLSFKRPVATAEPVQVGWADAADFVFCHPDGTRIPLTDGKVDQPWLPGETLISWVNGARPAIFINDGAPLLLTRAEGAGGLTISLPATELPCPGATTTIRIIGLGGTYEHRDQDIYTRVCTAMGLTGDPQYAVSLTAGEILSRRLFLEIDGAGKGTVLTIPPAELPLPIPTIVRNLNDRWPVVLFDQSTNRWRPLGIIDGAAYATLDTAQPQNLFIGHPVLSSHPQVVLSLSQVADDQWTLEAHNPLGVAVEAEIAPSPHFPLLDWEGTRLQLAPGSSEMISIPMRATVEIQAQFGR